MLSTIENVASNFKYQHMIYLFIAAENYINKKIYAEINYGRLHYIIANISSWNIQLNLM